MIRVWRTKLFGELSSSNGEREIARFATSKTADIFAYFAYYRELPHPREYLIEML